jgi:hypothetical protein
VFVIIEYIYTPGDYPAGYDESGTYDDRADWILSSTGWTQMSIWEYYIAWTIEAVVCV